MAALRATLNDDGVVVPYERDPIVAKRVGPILIKIRDLSLRRGENGLCELLLVFRKDRVGPEAFKSDLFSFGIALTTPENELIFAAFRDDIGYLVVPKWVDAMVSVLPPLSTAAVSAVFANVPPVTVPPANPKRRDAKSMVAAPLEAMLQQYVPERDVGCVLGGRTASFCFALITEALSGASKSKPLSERFVTLLELRAYYAGWYSALSTASGHVLSDADFASVIETAWRSSGGQRAADRLQTAVGASGSPQDDALFNSQTVNLCGTLVSTALPHKSKFVEIREAIDCPSRVVGYQGHMATAQEHFGETFHRIEASLPAFNGRPPQNDSLYEYQDFAHSFVRQGNKANTHNFRFA